MTSLDLRQYVVAPTGTWFNDAANFQPTLLRLVAADDGLTLVGPLRVKICVLAQNRMTHVSARTSTLQTKDVYSYTLDIPPGQSWSYPLLREALLAQSGQATLATSTPDAQPTLSLLKDTSSGQAGGGGLSINTGGGGGSSGAASTTGGLETNLYARQILLNRALIGANAGAVILIRPAGNELCGDPCGASNPCSDDPCTSKRSCGCSCGCASCGSGNGCGCQGGCSCSSSCGCGGCASTSDLPCDFAVRGQNVGAIFPSPCEPCTPGAPVSMPATKGPALLVRPASGGTVRTRFFPGMHMAKEDFETEQKNARVKRALLNRAIGQGVAWGFSVGLDGDGVCVTPGYGLDCCGNDVVLTSAYRVDAAALVADPLAAQIVAKRGAHRMALVLEYFECPQDPRPVHGDPCSLDGARCEPSRVRETARLRLAPPCDVDDSGPIKDFLAEVEKLRADPAVGHLFAPAAAAAGCDCTSGAMPLSLAVPFAVTLEVVRRVDVLPPNGFDLAPPTLPLAVPAAGAPDAQGDTFLPRQQERIIPSTVSVRITATAQGGYKFVQSGAPTPIDPTSGQPLGAALSLYPLLTNATQVAWEVPWGNDPMLDVPAGADPIHAQYIHRFGGWQLQDGSGNTFNGSIDVLWTKLLVEAWDASAWGKKVLSGGVPGEVFPTTPVGLVVHLDVPASTMSSTGGGRIFPCLGEPCDPRNAKFWKTFPFLHADPQNPNRAADWRVIVLAVLYVALAGEMQRTAYGTSAYVKDATLETASAAYAAAWKLYFGTMPDTERYSLTEALQRLLQAWCKGLLYPGPTCRCCPHGVVVGCAVVEGGSIVSVDPWGGRRWVVQYPLLSYWGQQFGLMPADAIASRLFGMICCFASLPAPKFEASTGNDVRARSLFVAPGVRPTEPTIGRGSTIQMGPGTLVVDAPSAVGARVQAFGPVRTETLGPMDFVAKVSSMIGAADGAGPGTPLVDYAVTGFPELHFVAPDTTTGASGTSAAAVAPPAAGSVHPFGQLVADEVASHVGKGAAPRLLRPVAESLAFSLAASLPLDTPLVLRGAFASAGIDTVGKVLDRDPEQFLQTGLKGQNADAFSAVLDAAEAQVRSVVTVVVESVALAAADKELTARADLRVAATANLFAKLLGDRLKAAKIDVPVAAVVSAVTEAAG